MATTLSNIINDTAVLINDPNFSFTSQSQVIRWINEARVECAKRTGCIRRLITGRSAFGASAQPGVGVPGAMQPGALPGAVPSTVAPQGVAANLCMTIPNVERYPYKGFFNPFLQKAYAGVDGVQDVIQCSVNWGGTYRPALQWYPWDDFQALLRSFSVLNSSYPCAWAVYNDGPDGEVWLYPVPSQAGEFELDVYCSPKGIYKDSDPDAIPEAFRSSIKYLAASYVFQSSGRYAQAQYNDDKFSDSLGLSRVSVDRGKVRNYYA
jgi:hypothetical protein